MQENACRHAMMLIIVSVITASATLQAAGGLDYMVNVAVRILKRHPNRITFLAPIATWFLCILTGTAHTCYALLPIIAEIAHKEKVRPERPLSVATISASLGCTGSPVSAATAAILTEELLGARGIGLKDIMMVTIPALRPSVNGHPLDMSTTIEIVMMSIAALILLVGKAKAAEAARGNVFASGLNAMVSIFGVAWMGSTFFLGHQTAIISSVEGVFSTYPLLFAVPLFLFSIMLFSQAATTRTLYPVGLALGVPPYILLALFPAVNGYFFLPNYPTEVAAIGFDRTGTTRIGRYVVNHSFQLAGWTTTVVSIAVAYLIITLSY